MSSVNSSDLRDDDRHHATDALAASAIADETGGVGLGSLLYRVKYADGTVHKLFESGTNNLAALLRIWVVAVTEKAQARKWVPTPRTAWDMDAAYGLYRRVAEASLAHWMDGRCNTCNGTGIQVTQHACPSCKGTKRAQIVGGRLESEKIADMVGELEGLYQAHGGRAAAMLRN
ncbi:hypothetical protein [Glaciimonas sp. PCH181]|uniref:hypothetical protein n=1 Tax=Glaciimonas sp. PCH181 TaxID=2133943 RepID=UPI001CEC2A40|nr:hypothetical protein [Glaciimonas sp. PCH181]